MTQEEKELLIKDLYTRLPYGVIYDFTHKFISTEMGNGKIRAIYVNDCIESDFAGVVINQTETGIGYVKPYLRPMSSMTEEENEEYEHLVAWHKEWEVTDWLNSHHFDYYGLIEKGLAIEAPDEMYNTK